MAGLDAEADDPEALPREAYLATRPDEHRSRADPSQVIFMALAGSLVAWLAGGAYGLACIFVRTGQVDHQIPMLFFGASAFGLLMLAIKGCERLAGVLGVVRVLIALSWAAFALWGTWWGFLVALDEYHLAWFGPRELVTRIGLLWDEPIWFVDGRPVSVGGKQVLWVLEALAILVVPVGLALLGRLSRLVCAACGMTLDESWLRGHRSATAAEPPDAIDLDLAWLAELDPEGSDGPPVDLKILACPTHPAENLVYLSWKRGEEKKSWPGAIRLPPGTVAALRQALDRRTTLTGPERA